jgi:hypothetical protein
MATYKKISTVTVGSGGALAIEFTSIPQTYTDLVLRLSTRIDEAGQGRCYVRWRFNDSATGYSYRWTYGFDSNNVSSVLDSNLTAAHIYITNGPLSTSSTFGNTEFYIPNYTGSSNKSFYIDGVTENNTSSTYMLSLSSSFWANTAAINKIALQPNPFGGGTLKFVEHSTATLYGIKNS